MLGELEGEVEVLLDEEDRHLPLEQLSQDASNLLDRRGLDSLRGLVQQQQPRARDQRPGNGELLLLATGKIAAPAPLHGAQDGKELLQLFAGRDLAAACRRLGDDEVLGHRQARENLPPLWNVPDSAAGALVDRHRGDVLAVQDHCP